MATATSDIRELFLAALEHPQDKRAAYLDEACNGNIDLRQRIEALLRAHDEPGAFLGEGKPDPNLTTSHELHTRLLGTVIAGRYKLLEQIGDGGMGTVWMAEQQKPVKRMVAVKLIKAGMDSKAILARFDAERQALALMDHPNIAKVLDGGTTDEGYPYFVMELVKGLPLTEYCDSRKLSVNDRLNLFVQICSAVQHAHQKAVMHRDLKPSNILVTEHDGKPVPKVIDFGLAKALNSSNMLTERTLHTAYGAVVGTPLYMAPELVGINALDVDTRADIYALGVILYELLTGTTPLEKARFKEAAWDEIKRVIREEEPPKPSTRLSSDKTLASLAATRQVEPAQLQRLIRGELDWIVMKALDKDRARRYETANGLAKDVQRYLSGDTVEACPPTLGYRLQKVYRRNRGAILTAGAFATVLLIAAAVSLAFAIQAWQSEKLAAESAEAAKGDRDKAITAGAETAKALDKLQLTQKQQAEDQYVWDMQALSVAFEMNNAAEMTRLLNRHRPNPGQSDHRGIEWHHWDRRLHAELLSDKLSEFSPGFGAVSDDGSHVALVMIPPSAVSAEKNPKQYLLKVINLETRQVVLTNVIPDDELPLNLQFEVVISRDGRRVAYMIRSTKGSPQPANPQYRLRVVDVATGRLLLSIDTPSHTLGRRSFERIDERQLKAAFSPNNQLFAMVVEVRSEDSTLRQAIRVWDLNANKEVCAPLHGDGLAVSPFSTDCKRLATVRLERHLGREADRVSVWDLTTGRESAGWDLPASSCLHDLAYDPVGNQLAGLVGDRPDATTMRESNPNPFTLPMPQPRKLLFWNAGTPQPAREFFLATGRDAGYFTVSTSFNKDGSRLAIYLTSMSLRNMDIPHAVTIWDTQRGMQLPSLRAQRDSNVMGLTGKPMFSPDGSQILQVDFNHVRTWETDTGKPIQTLIGMETVAMASFTPDGKRIRAVDYTGHLKEWNATPTNRVVIPDAFGGAPLLETDFTISADGSRVFGLGKATSNEHTDRSAAVVRVWDATGRLIRSLAVPHRAIAAGIRVQNQLTASRDGRRVLLYREEWNPQSPTQPVHPPEIIAWDVETGKRLAKTIEFQSHQVSLSPTISPDGRYVAVRQLYSARPDGKVAEPTDRTIQLFDMSADGQERKPIDLPWAARITGTDFLPDGRLGILVQPNDNSNAGLKMVVWHVEQHVAQTTIELPGSSAIAIPVCWSPDGKRFLFGDNFNLGGYAIYDASEGRPAGKKLEVQIGEGFSVQAFAWSPDSKRIAGFVSLTGQKPQLKLWDANTGRDMMRIQAPAVVQVMTFRDDQASMVTVNSEIVVSAKQTNTTGQRTLVLTTHDTRPRPETAK